MPTKRSWSAEGILQPLWHAYGEGKARREQLADAVGTNPEALSAINSGSRNLGLDLAQRIAKVTGVSLLDLGAPDEADEVEAATIHQRLSVLVSRVEQLEADQRDVVDQLRDLGTQLREHLDDPPGVQGEGGEP